ncbi:MAG: FAD-dependent oxidoreductase [Candidatus Zipacnadales bacterium]
MEFLMLLPLVSPCYAERPMAILADFETQAAVDAFASQVRYAMVEPITHPTRHGDGAMQIRFFGHPSLENEPRVVALYQYGGFAYSNWRPYNLLSLDVFNAETRGLSLQLLLWWNKGRERGELVLPVDLPPTDWTTIELNITNLAERGLDVAAVAGFGLQLPLEDTPRPARIIVDFIRLLGGDVAEVRQARRVEKCTASLRVPRQAQRTDATQLAAMLKPIGSVVRRYVKAPVVAEPEVLVVGGGLAGVAAAVTAARWGADVLLVERSSALGGMATLGLVPPAFNEGLTGGIVREFCDRLDKVGGPAENRNPEVMKYVLLEMLQESGARLMLYTLAVDAIVRDNVIQGILVESKSGPQAILSDITIDCTGDADIAARAGVPFEIGRGRDEETQTQTLVFLLGNVNTDKLMPARQHLPEYVAKARANGDWHIPFAGGAAIQPVVVGEHGVVNVNSINIPGVSGLNVADLTYSHIEAHREALQLVDFYRKYVPGCEECYLLSTAPFIGVRESRRIIGEYRLTGEEVLAGAEFEDGIARGFYPIDIHSPDPTGDAAGARLTRPYEIPYRCLIPQKIDNLLVAGRPISADHVAHGSLRVMGTTMPLGEAAGCAAALCLQRGCRPRELDGKRVRRMLKKLGSQPQTIRNVPHNLALSQHGVIARADSYHDSYPNSAPNAIDGLVTRDNSSRWLSADTPPPHWIELQFPAPTECGRVKLHFYSGNDGGRQYIPLDFEVQVQRAQQWVKVAAIKNNSELSPELTFRPVTADALRILFTAPCLADNIVRLREIEVYPAP